MQAKVHLITFLVLFSTVTHDFAQPAPPPNVSLPGTNDIRRRFQRTTNEALTDPNATRPAFPTLPVPGRIRSADTVRSNAAALRSQQMTATNPAVTGAIQNVPPTNAAEMQTVVIDQTSAVVAETNVATNIEIPAPGAATNALPVPGTDRISIPMPPGGAAATDTAVTAVGPDGEPVAFKEGFSPVNPALSPDEIIPGGTVALNVMPLEQFFDVYSLYSGRTILRQTQLPQQALTLKATTDLSRLEVVQAMDGVLALNGITMIPIGDKFVKAVPSTMAATEGDEISDVPADQLPFAEQFITRIVKLKTAKPTELAPTLQGLAKTPTAVTPIDSNQTLILRDYSSNIRRMLEVIEKIDVMPESDFTLEVIPVRYGKVGDIHATMQALISGAGGATGGGALPTTGAGAAGFSRGGQFGGGMNTGSRFGGMGSGSRLGGGGYNQGGGYRGGGMNYGGGGGNYYPYEVNQNGNGEISPLQVASPSAPGGAQSSFQSRINQIVNRAANPDEVKILENAQIVPDERSNKLLIFANKRDMAMITNIVSKVDVLLAQVLIEAVIMEVKLGDSMNMGVSMAQHPRQWRGDLQGQGAVNNGQLFSSLTNFPIGSPEGFSYSAIINDDFDIAMTAIARDSEIKIVSRPRIHTSHAMPGFFFIGETVPYVTGTFDYGGVVGGVGSRSTINERQVGLTLEVTPIITPEGMVIMDIVQDFQQRGQDVIIDGNPIPLVNSRSAGSFLTVRNGDLIMLGGFISETRSTSKGGVPFLKDIPGLGVLFRSSAKSNDRTELIMLIKATVLDSPEQAAFLAEQERLMLPGVRQAEHEFEKSETKRLQKAEKRTRR
jgi:general secretion pathway protein D